MIKLIWITSMLYVVQVMTLNVKDAKPVYEGFDEFPNMENVIKKLVEREVKIQLDKIQETHKRELDELFSRMNTKHHNLERQIKMVTIKNSVLMRSQKNYERKMEVKFKNLVDKCVFKSAQLSKSIIGSANYSEPYNQEKESLRLFKPKQPTHAEKHVRDTTVRERQRGNRDDAEILSSRVRSTPLRNGVAFYAQLKVPLSNVGDNQHIEFNHVVTQEGHDYNGSTGTFICSVPGVYVFTITLQVVPNKWIEANIVRNGSHIAFVCAYNKNHGTSHSSSALVRLNVGDTVWVIVSGPYHDSGHVLDAYTSTFTGFLLYQ